MGRGAPRMYRTPRLFYDACHLPQQMVLDGNHESYLQPCMYIFGPELTAAGNWKYTTRMAYTQEQEIMFSALAVANYFTKHARRVDAPHVKMGLRDVRAIITKELHKMGYRGRRGVTLRMRYAAEKILHDIRRLERGLRRRERYISTFEIEQAVYFTTDIVADSCHFGLSLPRLIKEGKMKGSVTERTWQEQMTGRATLMVKRQWPEIGNYF